MDRDLRAESPDLLLHIAGRVKSQQRQLHNLIRMGFLASRFDVNKDERSVKRERDGGQRFGSVGHDVTAFSPGFSGTGSVRRVARGCLRDFQNGRLNSCFVQLAATVEFALGF